MNPAGAEEREAVHVDAAVRGDVNAFAALYDRHLERVYRHVYYRVGRPQDAEDITQQVFLQAWRAIGYYKRTGAPFISWLLTIAHNQIITFYRRARNTSSLEADFPDYGAGANPEAEVLAQFDRVSVRKAILRLKPEQQIVIIMRFLEHLSYSDIATSLQKTEGNIRTIQYRALLELRRLLGPQMRLS